MAVRPFIGPGRWFICSFRLLLGTLLFSAVLLILTTVLKADTLLRLALGRLFWVTISMRVFLGGQPAYDVVLQGFEGIVSIVIVDLEESICDILVNVVDECLLASGMRVNELCHVHHTSFEENDVAVVLLGVPDPLLLRTVHNYIPRRSLIEALGRHLPQYQPPVFQPRAQNQRTLGEGLVLLIQDYCRRGIILLEYYIEERGNITKISDSKNRPAKVQRLGIVQVAVTLRIVHKFFSHVEFEKTVGKKTDLTPHKESITQWGGYLTCNQWVKPSACLYDAKPSYLCFTFFERMLNLSRGWFLLEISSQRIIPPSYLRFSQP